MKSKPSFIITILLLGASLSTYSQSMDSLQQGKNDFGINAIILQANNEQKTPTCVVLKNNSSGVDRSAKRRLKRKERKLNATNSTDIGEQIIMAPIFTIPHLPVDWSILWERFMYMAHF